MAELISEKVKIIIMEVAWAFFRGSPDFIRVGRAISPPAVPSSPFIIPAVKVPARRYSFFILSKPFLWHWSCWELFCGWDIKVVCVVFGLL